MHTKLAGDVFLKDPQCKLRTYRTNLCFSNKRTRVLLPLTYARTTPHVVRVSARESFGIKTRSVSVTFRLTTFGVAIVRVVGVRTDKKMFGVDARGGVTFVTDAQTGWDGASRELPR